jgi:hypothetical protein
MPKMTNAMMEKMLRLHHARVSNFGKPQRKQGRTISQHTKPVLDAAVMHHEQAMTHINASKALISSLLVGDGTPADVKAELAAVLASWRQADID